MSRTLQWAGGHFSAAHTSDDGVMHGHTWRVRVFWLYEGESGVDKAARLKAELASFDHTTLPHELRRSEDIAARLGECIGAAEVHVWRDAEELGAIWFAE